MKKLEIRFSIISLVCASIALLFGAVVLTGWFFQVSELIQLTPIAFIQTNTALCFLLSGTALLFLDRSYLKPVRIFSIVILVFGGLTLCEYVFNLNIGIDELLFKDFIYTGASHPNRMAPNTALCFFLYAIALYTSTYLIITNKGNLTTAILSALVFVLASTALSGFMVGLEEAFGWGRMTRMSPQTAIGLLIISTGLISLAWKNAVRVEGGFPLWSAPFASVMVLTIFVGIWQSLVIGERQFMKSDIRLNHETMVNKVHFELKDRLLALERMGSRFVENFAEDNYKAEWEADAKNYLNHYGDFSSIDWVDSDYYVKWKLVYSGSKGSHDLNLIDSAQLSPVMHLSQETRKTLISPVYSNFKGQKIFSVFSPLFHEEKFIGFIRGNFIVENFMEKIFGKGKGEIQSSFFEDGLVFFERKVDEPADPEQWMVSSSLGYKGLKWFVQCIPSETYLAGMRSVKPEVVMVFGMMLAWALGAAVSSNQRVREHEKELTSSNRRLEEEYNKGQQQSRALELSQKKYKTLFSQVKSIIEDVSCCSGYELYESLAKNLAESMGFKYCVVGELDSKDDRKIQTLAVWGDGKFLDNFIYDLSGTPCENVVGKALCSYSCDVWKSFPDDRLMADLKIESYIGIPLNDSSNNSLGILLAMHDEPINDFTDISLIFPLFADAVGSEMERQRYDAQMQWESEMVQASRDIVMASNDIRDFNSILSFVLKRLCQFMGWPVGHLYLKEDASTNLVPTRIWSLSPPSKYEVFKEVTERTTFELGVGLPGRVMKTKHPEWIRDVYKDENFPRAKMSDQLGVHSAFACPIIVREEVAGVMEFFTPQILDIDGELLDMVERVATQVARVLEREKAEEKLRKQAQVLDQIHDAVISLDGKSKITGWNKGAERIFGYEEEEMIGKQFSYMFCGVESFVKEKLIQPTLISGKYEKEMKVITKSGAIVYIHFSLSSVCDDNCIPVGLLCYALDITERKNFEISQREKDNELDKAHKRNQMILNAAGEGIYGIDCEGDATFVNPSAAKMLGYDAKELIGKPQHFLRHHLKEGQSGCQREDCPICVVFEDGLTHSESDEVFWRKDGSSFPVEYVSTPIYEDERICGAVVTFKDISEKKKVQLALEEYSQNLEKRVEQRTAELNASVEKIKESRDQTEGILKSIGEGLIVTDLSGTVVLMNFAAEKIIGVNVGDALGKAADQVIQNDVLLSQIMGETGESGKPFDFELGGENGNKQKKFIQGISTSTHEAEESLVGSVTVLRDVTFERKVDNLKSQFLSTAAHELRTPLTTLQGFSEILLSKKNLPEESVDRYLKYINEESLRLGKIINDFLDISRIESGREIRLDKRSCVVSKIIDRSVQLFSEAHKASHEFVFQYLSKTDKWNVDLEKMEQVFKNLYSNAVKYSPDGGTITTSVRSVNGHIEVAIEDQGVGMSKDAVNKVFDKYYRGEDMEKSVPGSGLGMTIVKYILEAHGGSVSVESEPGKGTKVVMCVPNK